MPCFEDKTLESCHTCSFRRHRWKSYPVRLANLAVRINGDPWNSLAAIQAEVRALDKEQPVFQPMTFEDLISQRAAPRRFNAMLLMMLAVVSLSLALVGVYGVMSFVVANRIPEIGVRVALGASPAKILSLFLGSAFSLTGLGVCCGLAISFALSRFLAGLLFEITPTDPTTFLIVAAAVLFAALMACYLPARRATRVDPLVALRYE